MATAVRRIHAWRNIFSLYRISEQLRHLHISQHLYHRVPALQTLSHAQSFHSSPTRLYAEEAEEGEEGTEDQEQPEETPKRPIIDIDTSIRYMKSKAFQTTYGDVPVWVPYRRNFKGQRLPMKTRQTCIRGGVVSTGNPCPICRDEYLVIHPKNVELLKQFVSPKSGQVLHYNKTGVCQKQHKKLLIAVHQARDQGLLEMPVPFRKYDYSQYYPQLKQKQQ